MRILLKSERIETHLKGLTTEVKKKNQVSYEHVYGIDRLFFSHQRCHRTKFAVDHLGYQNYGNCILSPRRTQLNLKMELLLLLFSAMTTAIIPMHIIIIKDTSLKLN